MSNAVEIDTSAAARPTSWRLRSDLHVLRCRGAAGERIVVKDPVSLRYFHLPAEEFALLSSLDGRRSLRDIQDKFQTDFRPQTITTEEIQRLLWRAQRDRLIVSDRPGQAARLAGHHSSRWWAFWHNVLSNPLAIRLPGVDPDGWLSRLNRYLGWLF